MADWRMRAACRGEDSELFFPDSAAYSNGTVAYAKTVCRRCPVSGKCLTAAIDGREKAGIWGGLTPDERAKLHRRQQRRAAKPLPPVTCTQAAQNRAALAAAIAR